MDQRLLPISNRGMWGFFMWTVRPTAIEVFALAALALMGCATHEPVTAMPAHPDLAPQAQARRADAIALDASTIKPMHQELLAIDLPTIVRVAAADNIAIRQARLDVDASRGRLDSRIGSAFPALAPTALFEIVDGNVRATQGNIVDVGFKTFHLFLAVEWVINPGRVYYEIVAAKKRLAASEHQERTVTIQTLHDAVNQYYDLALAQAQVAVAEKSLDEAKELLRINELRLRTGVGVPADKLRAEANLAERQQDLLNAMNRFYRASVALAVTLRLDAAVTLIPKVSELRRTTLVRDDLTIDDLAGLAMRFRPDLQGIRSVVEAVGADRGSAWWGGFGPQFQTVYLIGGIEGHDVQNVESIENRTGFNHQQRFVVGSGLRLSAATFGNLRTADAVIEQTVLEAERVQEEVKSQVVTALQNSRTTYQLIDLAWQQVQAAQEALRLTQTNLTAGTMTTLDVLQSEDALARARLRHTGAVVGYNQSQVDLLTALGLIDEHGLGLSIPEEGPEPHR